MFPFRTANKSCRRKYYGLCEYMSFKSNNPVLFTKKFFNNKFIFGAFGIGVLLLALVLFVPAVSTIFKAEPLNIVQIIMIAATSIGTLILIQLIKFIKKSVKK